MTKLIQYIDTLNRYTGHYVKYLILPLTLIVLYEVCCRRLFNSPTSWAFDMTTYIFGAYFILGLGYVELHDRHIRIDVISQQLPQKVQTWLRILTFPAFFVPFIAALTWAGVELASDSWAMWEHGQSAWRPPIYPVKTILPIGAFLLLLQGFSSFVKDIRKLKSGGGHES
jgi:TRAP-type mannitol/chloroaromatic compound transport system permease small subunit